MIISQFNIQWPYKRPFDKEYSRFRVSLQTDQGRYATEFVTKRYIQKIESMSKQNTEKYDFNGLVVIDVADDQTIKSKLEEIVSQNQIDRYFVKVQ